MTKVVCRLLDADGALLGWVEHPAAIRGDGALRASWPVTVLVERDGLWASVSWHWADVNVEARVPVTERRVTFGQVVTVAAYGDPLIRCGPMPGPLPAVTVRQPVALSVPAGAMGARG